MQQYCILVSSVRSDVRWEDEANTNPSIVVCRGNSSQKHMLLQMAY